MTNSTDESSTRRHARAACRRFHHSPPRVRARGLLPRNDHRSGLGGPGDRHRRRRSADRHVRLSHGPHGLPHRPRQRHFQLRRSVHQHALQPAAPGARYFLAVFIIALPWIGTTLGLFLVLIACMRLLGVTSIRQLVTVAAATAATVYVLLIYLVSSRLPQGPVEWLIAWISESGPDRGRLRHTSPRTVRTLDLAVVGDPARHDARHHRRHPAGLQRAEHADHPAAADALHGHRGRHGLHDRALLHDPARRRHPGDPVQHAGRGRRGRHHPRRLSDDQEGPGAAGAGAVLRGVGVRRPHHHRRDDGDAAGARASSGSTSAASRWSSSSCSA